MHEFCATPEGLPRTLWRPFHWPHKLTMVFDTRATTSIIPAATTCAKAVLPLLLRRGLKFSCAGKLRRNRLLVPFGVRDSPRPSVVPKVDSVVGLELPEETAAKAFVRRRFSFLGHILAAKSHFMTQDVPRKILQVRRVILGYSHKIDPPPGEPGQSSAT